jgi:hypothetical protein
LRKVVRRKPEPCSGWSRAYSTCGHSVVGTITILSALVSLLSFRVRRLPLAARISTTSMPYPEFAWDVVCHERAV